VVALALAESAFSPMSSLEALTTPTTWTVCSQH
jgi:hypothetical protein